MCGISGYITKKRDKRNVGIMAAMLMAIQSRGRDSTGVAAGGELYKRTGDAIDFVDEIDLSPLSYQRRALGHTRAATTGAVNVENAHPHHVGRVTGVHNGMISNWRELYTGGEVDTMAIWHVLSEYGPDKIKEAFAEITGSCAAIWQYDHDPALYCIAHSNPLSMALTKNGYYLLSVQDDLKRILTTALYRETIKIKKLPEDCVIKINPDLSLEKTDVTFKKVDYNYSRGSWHGKRQGGVSGNKIISSMRDDEYDPRYPEPYSADHFVMLNYPNSKKQKKKHVKRMNGLYTKWKKDNNSMFFYLAREYGCFKCRENPIEGMLTTRDFRIYCYDCFDYELWDGVDRDQWEWIMTDYDPDIHAY